MSEGEMVHVSLSWTYGVKVSGKIVYFGPGDRVPVPADVAQRMRWRPLADVRAQTPDVAETAVLAQPMVADVASQAGVVYLVDALEAAGFATAESIRTASEAELTAVSGVGKATAAKLKTAAKELLG